MSENHENIDDNPTGLEDTIQERGKSHEEHQYIIPSHNLYRATNTQKEIRLKSVFFKDFLNTFISVIIIPCPLKLSIDYYYLL